MTCVLSVSRPLPFRMNVAALVSAYVQDHDLDQCMPVRCRLLGVVGLEEARATSRRRHDKHADLLLTASDRFLPERLQRLVME